MIAAIHSLKEGKKSEPVDALNEKVAVEVYERIKRGEEDFWGAVYRPYCANEITREMVKLILSQARTDGGGSLSKMAVDLKACLPHFNQEEEERRKFIRFKNFLYKTVRIAH
ncbi:MAG: hypothetical protein QHH30_08435 [candidate division NC10 bacterium]|nr:hypothetical protein [candidate division NC10 bacterium]